MTYINIERVTQSLLIDIRRKNNINIRIYNLIKNTNPKHKYISKIRIKHRRGHQDKVSAVKNSVKKFFSGIIEKEFVFLLLLNLIKVSKLNIDQVVENTFCKTKFYITE